MGALAVVPTRRNAVAKAVARPGNCSGAARARAAANARFRLLDAAGALCRGTGVRETRLRCFGAAQCQVRRLSVYTSTEQPEGMTPRSYLHSTWRWGGGGLLRGSQGCRAAPGTSERGARCAFVLGCRKRLPRWAGWMHDSSPRPLASLGILASDQRAVDHLITCRAQRAGLRRWAEGMAALRMASQISVVDRRGATLPRRRIGQRCSREPETAAA